MSSEYQIESMLERLKNPSIDIITKNQLALLVSETQDMRVLNVLHKLIKQKEYENKRGTFVYCLLNFRGEFSFDLAIDLMIDGNFEVAHTAFNVIANIEDVICGEQVEQAFVRLKSKSENCVSIEIWRKDLIRKALQLFD